MPLVELREIKRRNGWMIHRSTGSIFVCVAFIKQRGNKAILPLRSGKITEIKSKTKTY